MPCANAAATDAFAQPAVEADREDARGVVVDRAGHPDDAIDVRCEGLRHRTGERRVQHDEPHPHTRRCERLPKGRPRDAGHGHPYP
jgi:hypothetical protein